MMNPEFKSVIVTLLFAALFAIWNGLVIKWYLTKDQKWSKCWHGLGFIIRAIPIALIYPNWLWILIYTNIAWTIYDIIINLFMGQSIFYIGKTSTFDKTFGKWLFVGKALLLILTILILIL